MKVRLIVTESKGLTVSPRRFAVEGDYGADVFYIEQPQAFDVYDCKAIIETANGTIERNTAGTLIIDSGMTVAGVNNIQLEYSQNGTVMFKTRPIASYEVSNALTAGELPVAPHPAYNFEFHATAETLPPESQATANADTLVEDDTYTTVLTIGVPRGADGKDGADGRDGVDGKDGEPGPQGEQGPPGQDGGTSPEITNRLESLENRATVLESEAGNVASLLIEQGQTIQGNTTAINALRERLEALEAAMTARVEPEAQPAVASVEVEPEPTKKASRAKKADKDIELV